MALQMQQLISEVEEIKRRVITLETALIEEEEASKDDVEALKTAKEDLRMRKVVPFKH